MLKRKESQQQPAKELTGKGANVLTDVLLGNKVRFQKKSTRVQTDDCKYTKGLQIAS